MEPMQPGVQEAKDLREAWKEFDNGQIPKESLFLILDKMVHGIDPAIVPKEVAQTVASVIEYFQGVKSQEQVNEDLGLVLPVTTRDISVMDPKDVQKKRDALLDQMLEHPEGSAERKAVEDQLRALGMSRFAIRKWAAEEESPAEEEGFDPFAQDSEPSEDDIIIQDERGAYRAYESGHMISERRGDDAYDLVLWDVKQYMDKTQYWPTVWEAEERGGHHIVDMGNVKEPPPRVGEVEDVSDLILGELFQNGTMPKEDLWQAVFDTSNETDAERFKRVWEAAIKHLGDKLKMEGDMVSLLHPLAKGKLPENAPETVSEIPTMGPKDLAKKRDELLDQMNALHPNQKHKREQIERQLKSLGALLRQASNPWDIYLNGKHIDTVFDVSDSADEVRKSLINHDGYDPNIEVEFGGEGEPKKLEPAKLHQSTEKEIQEQVQDLQKPGHEPFWTEGADGRKFPCCTEHGNGELKGRFQSAPSNMAVEDVKSLTSKEVDKRRDALLDQLNMLSEGDPKREQLKKQLKALGVSRFALKLLAADERVSTDRLFRFLTTGPMEVWTASESELLADILDPNEEAQALHDMVIEKTMSIATDPALREHYGQFQGIDLANVDWHALAEKLRKLHGWPSLREKSAASDGFTADDLSNPDVVDKIMDHNEKLWDEAVEDMAIQSLIKLKQEWNPQLWDENKAAEAVACAYGVGDVQQVYRTPIMKDVLDQVLVWMSQPKASRFAQKLAASYEEYEGAFGAGPLEMVKDAVEKKLGHMDDVVDAFYPQVVDFPENERPFEAAKLIAPSLGLDMPQDEVAQLLGKFLEGAYYWK